MEQEKQSDAGEENLPFSLSGDFGYEDDGKEDREGEGDIESDRLHIDRDIELKIVAFTVDISQWDLVFDSEDHLLAMDTAFDGYELIVGGCEMKSGGGDEIIVVFFEIDPAHQYGAKEE